MSKASPFVTYSIDAMKVVKGENDEEMFISASPDEAEEYILIGNYISTEAVNDANKTLEQTQLGVPIFASDIEEEVITMYERITGKTYNTTK
jgi:nitrogen regulatory protein PII-like uncharacterized protein